MAGGATKVLCHASLRSPRKHRRGYGKAFRLRFDSAPGREAIARQLASRDDEGEQIVERPVIRDRRKQRTYGPADEARRRGDRVVVKGLSIGFPHYPAKRSEERRVGEE